MDNKYIQTYEFKSEVEFKGGKEVIYMKFDLEEGNLGNVVEEFANFLERCGYQENSIDKYLKLY